jgi:hypothetical protein
MFKKKPENMIDTPHKNKYSPMSVLSTLNGEKERRDILSTIKKPEIVVGSYAFNRQVKYPIYQKRPFTDVDILSTKQKQTALDIEQKLDSSVGMNNYYITKLDHDSGITYRIHSRGKGNSVVADVSELSKNIPSVTINNVSFETLKHRKQEISKILKKKDAEYRREKDTRMMNYIKRYEQLLKQEKRKKWM